MSNAKETIIEAFLQLLYEKKFEDLTVKQIIQKAGFSRSTFYLHFADKYELMEDVRWSLNGQFLSFYETSFYQWGKPVTHYLCEHIFTYRSFYEVEFTDAKAARQLSNKLATRLMEAFHDQDYAIFASFGTIGYLSFWVKSGFEMSPAEAADKLLKIGLTDWTKGLDMDRGKMVEEP
ncbi:TetR/AcrR family transcriptional regulator [Radiobacillus kanasensis]|uniref:TetR/AcrR family transcriptional regulator n=1 Tax=Radiobacillus kanasensis TaxID=2844358 RepID=UPI001E425EE7|nr:TetR/AcrR family transcriptional regulator [Radiobacillus kanasensis]UFT99960.1 TetR/AcrR family transcriptional regulator [Radiobacillus kanasensis]